MTQCEDNYCRNAVARVLLGVFGCHKGDCRKYPYPTTPPVVWCVAYLCDYHMKPYLESKNAKTMYVRDYDELVSQGYSYDDIYKMIEMKSRK